jgi:peroxiredoxin
MPSFRSWILLAAMALAQSAWAGAVIGEPAPPLRGTLFSGHPLDLQAMRGKVVLVNFFSSYCKFCAYEIGNVQTFYERHRGEGFEVIVVAIDDPADRARVEGMVGSYGLQGIMADDLEQNGFERRYPTPTAFVIDRKGVVRSQTRGAKLPFWFAEQVIPLLAEE